MPETPFSSHPVDRVEALEALEHGAEASRFTPAGAVAADCALCAVAFAGRRRLSLIGMAKVGSSSESRALTAMYFSGR